MAAANTTARPLVDASSPSTAGAAPAGSVPKGRAGFAQWVFELYSDQLRGTRPEGGRKYQQLLRQSLDQPFWQLSGVRRIQSFNVLKYGYPMRSSGYTVSVHVARIHAPDGGRRALRSYYAYAFWPPGGARPEYISISSTFRSRDGEYRSNFIWYDDFAWGFEQSDERLARVEEMILDATSHNVLGLDTEVFPSDQFGAVAARSDAERLGIKALAVAWALDAGRAQSGLLANHVHPDYIEIMRRLFVWAKERDRRGGSPAVTESPPFESQERLYALFTSGHRGSGADRAKCGAKLIPLSLRAAVSPGDINYASWREIYIGRRCADLVVNFVAPMFPTPNNWTYIDGAEELLFENAPMREMYRRGEAAEGVLAALRRARQELSESGYSGDAPVQRLDAGVYAQIEYAQSYLLMAEAALCHTSENLGPTLAALPAIVRRSAQETRTFHHPHATLFSDPSRCARYLFDLLYGVHAMHKRCAVVHGDLHLNNVTLFTLGRQVERRSPSEPWAPRCPGASVAYVAGPRGAADTFVFPHDGSFACIIDFSRALLGPGARPDLEAEFGAAFADAYYRDQVKRTLQTIHRHLPEYTQTHQEAIKGIALSNPEALFPVLAATDFLYLAQNFARLLESEMKADAGFVPPPSEESPADGPDDPDGKAERPEPGPDGGGSDGFEAYGDSPDVSAPLPPVRPRDLRPLGICPESVALARSAEKMAREFIIVGLHDLVTTLGGASAAARASGEEGTRRPPGPSTQRLDAQAVAGRLPGEVILPEVFRPYLYTSLEPEALREVRVVDQYRLGGRLEFSASDPSRFPPWGRYETVEGHLAGLKVSDVYARGTAPFEDALRLDSGHEILMDRLRRNLGSESPGAEGSSWIA